MSDLVPAGEHNLAKRASDADRERVARILTEHHSVGRLTLEEFSQRIDSAYAARTLADLEALTLDLTGPPPPPAPIDYKRQRRKLRRKELNEFMQHLGVYGITNGALTGMWAITSGFDSYFWPIWPILGWGIGVGIHGWMALFPSHDDIEKRIVEAELRERKQRLKLEGKRAALEVSERAIESIRKPKTGHARPGDVAARAAPARHWVTVLFTDIADSTRLVEVMGDEDWKELRRKHRELVSRAFESRGGTQISSQGDGFVARFPNPAEAASCAVEIQRELQRLRETSGFAPKVRIGIHAGEVLEDEGDLVGKVLHLASRVTDEAEPGEILVTEPVSDYLGGRFTLEDRGLRTLRGVSTPRHLLSVRWS